MNRLSVRLLLSHALVAAIGGLTTYLLVRLTRATLDPSVRWPDLAAVSAVAGVGFTVSLLIGELSFDPTSPHSESVKAAVLIGSLAAAALGAALLSRRTRVHVRQQDAHLEAAPTV